jgi:hypothetical protein
VRFPHRSAVKRSEGGLANLHVRKAPKPDKYVWPVEISKLADHMHPHELLRLDELAVEQLDQDIALTGPQRILPKLNDRTA